MAVFNDLVVKVPILKVKQAPDRCSETVDELVHGMVVCRLEVSNDGEYVKIRTLYNYEGWCLKSGFVTNEWNVRKYINRTDLKVSSLFIDVMEAPDIRSRVICTLVKGSLLALERNCDNGWVKVCLADGAYGYVCSSGIRTLVSIRSNTDIRESIVNDALMYIGTQYRWGGKTPMGIDCSGLTSMVYMNNGLTIHRDSYWMEGFGIERIDLCDAWPGDLLYFKKHIGIYIGDGRFIHSTMGDYGDGVMINSLNRNDKLYRQDLDEKFLYAGRKIKDN